MSTYVMSDFHGRHDLFLKMLEKISFCDEDTLYILGDVADRGPDGIKTFLYIMDKPNIIYLIGNHDIFLLDCARKALVKGGGIRLFHTQEFLLWMYNGGDPTWEQYSRLDRIQQRKILAYLANSYVIIPNLKVGDRNFYLCHATHADTPYQEPVKYKDADPEMRNHVVWDRVYPRYTRMSMEFDHISYDELYNKYPKNTKMIFGHTPTILFKGPERDGRGRIWHGGHGHLIDIDCGCAARSKENVMLGCLRLDDLAEFYTHY